MEYDIRNGMIRLVIEEVAFFLTEDEIKELQKICQNSLFDLNQKKPIATPPTTSGWLKLHIHPHRA